MVVFQQAPKTLLTDHWSIALEWIGSVLWKEQHIAFALIWSLVKVV